MGSAGRARRRSRKTTADTVTSNMRPANQRDLWLKNVSVGTATAVWAEGLGAGEAGSGVDDGGAGSAAAGMGVGGAWVDPSRVSAGGFGSAIAPGTDWEAAEIGRAAVRGRGSALGT